jgi:glycosyltransferase involved in cell wall biosynthesis
MNQEQKHKKFNDSEKKHILLITNHGCHSPVITVTTDTGGQNFYVNDLAKSFLELGFKVTILNRGGFSHPVTNKPHKGVVYYDSLYGELGLYCRVIYLEDGSYEFIQVHKLKRENLIKEKQSFFKISKEINLDLNNLYFINSHYWDGGFLGLLINRELEKNSMKKPHIWTPHELASMRKTRDYFKAGENAKTVRLYNLPTRIGYENKIIQEADAFVSTSGKLTLALNDYKSSPKNYLWYPPGVNLECFKPRMLEECTNGIKILAELLNKQEQEVRELLRSKLICFETSRTAGYKQKHLILEAFSKIKNKENAVLIMNADEKSDFYPVLDETFKKVKSDNIFLIKKFLSDQEKCELYSLCHLYITASLLEGWGMSIHEAAASKCAVISSVYVPFATEILNENALIVQENTPEAYAEKIDLIIENPSLIEKLSQGAYSRIISGGLTWKDLSRKLILDMKSKKIIN